MVGEEVFSACNFSVEIVFCLCEMGELKSFGGDDCDWLTVSTLFIWRWIRCDRETRVSNNFWDECLPGIPERG
jgi:hypothetical protein